jgi:ribonuclease-3 family protein
MINTADSLTEGLRGKNNKPDPKSLSPLVLAYIGDAFFELYIRCHIVNDNSRLSPDGLHRLTVDYVKATSQSDIIHRIWDYLDEEERLVVKRGRNAKSGAPPKGADMAQYRYATGFEALLGWLLLEGKVQRLIGILDVAYEQLQTDNEQYP